MMVIEAEEEVVVEIVIDVTHAVIGTLQIPMRLFAPPVGIITAAVDALALVPGLLTMIDITGPVAEAAVMKMTEFEIGAPVVTAIAAESEHQAQNAQKANPLRHSPLRMSAIAELSSYSNLRPD